MASPLDLEQMGIIDASFQIDTNSGILTCGIRTDANNAEYFFTGGEMTHARDIFCSNMTLNEPPIKFELGENNTKAGTYTAPDNVNNPIFISVRWRADAGSDCPTMDFSKNEDGEAYHLCQDRLNVPIHSCECCSRVYKTKTDNSLQAILTRPEISSGSRAGSSSETVSIGRSHHWPAPAITRRQLKIFASEAPH